MGKYKDLNELLTKAQQWGDSMVALQVAREMVLKENGPLIEDMKALLSTLPDLTIRSGKAVFTLLGGELTYCMATPAAEVSLPDALKAQPATDPAAKLDAAMAEDADAAQCWAKATPTDSLKGSVLHYAEPFEPAVDPDDFDAVREPKPAPRAEVRAREINGTWSEWQSLGSREVPQTVAEHVLNNLGSLDGTHTSVVGVQWQWRIDTAGLSLVRAAKSITADYLRAKADQQLADDGGELDSDEAEFQVEEAAREIAYAGIEVRHLRKNENEPRWSEWRALRGSPLPRWRCEELARWSDRLDHGNFTQGGDTWEWRNIQQHIVGSSGPVAGIFDEEIAAGVFDKPKPLSGGAPEADAALREQAGAWEPSAAERFGTSLADAILGPLRASNEAAIQHIDETLDRLRNDYRNTP